MVFFFVTYRVKLNEYPLAVTDTLFQMFGIDDPRFLKAYMDRLADLPLINRKMARVEQWIADSTIVPEAKELLVF